MAMVGGPYDLFHREADRWPTAIDPEGIARCAAGFARLAAGHSTPGLSVLQATVIEQVRAARCSFLLVAKPEDHTSLYQDIEGLRRGRLLDHCGTIDATGDRNRPKIFGG